MMRLKSAFEKSAMCLAAIGLVLDGLNFMLPRFQEVEKMLPTFMMSNWWNMAVPPFFFFAALLLLSVHWYLVRITRDSPLPIPSASLAPADRVVAPDQQHTTNILHMRTSSEDDSAPGGPGNSQYEFLPNAGKLTSRSPHEAVFLGDATPPSYFSSIFAENTAATAEMIVRPNIGFWIGVKGKVYDVDVWKGVGDEYMCVVPLQNTQFFVKPKQPDVILYFAGCEAGRARILKKFEEISVIGRISKMTGNTITLDRCLFVYDS